MSVTSVIDTQRVRYEVERKLGEGAQGTTYLLKADAEGKRHIAKLFNNLVGDTARLKRTVAFLRTLELDRLHFARPLRELAAPTVGYIAEFASGMIPVAEIKSPIKSGEAFSVWYKKTGGLRKRYEVLLNLAQVMRTLHGKGLVYCDLSPNNVFVSQRADRSAVFLIDLDNLKYKVGVLDTLFTPFYGAPEVVKRNAPNTPMSDAFSFAVLAYELLTLSHPLIGDPVSEGDPELEEQALAGKLSWVDHPDGTNVRSTGLPSGNVLAAPLKGLFARTFENGLNDAMLRPSMSEWCDAIMQGLDELLTCGSPDCGIHYPYNNRRACPFCQSVPQSVTRIQMRRWEQCGGDYDMKSRSFTSFRLEDRVYQEILLDMNTPKDICAYSFLLKDIDPSTSVLRAEQFQENGETKLRLTPLGELSDFFISKREPSTTDRPRNINPETGQKIRVTDSGTMGKSKAMVHAMPLTEAQRVLTIDRLGGE